tara:strand:+ start:445 stop:1215 length:771 start_codon:yes stop_codon:yes gene_type:complete
MTWFNFLRKDIVLHCYTSRPEVFNYAPIRKTTAFFPEWWKALPPSLAFENGLGSGATMKLCTGFTDLFAKGFVLPLWSDVGIDIEKKINPEVETHNYQFRYQFSDSTSSFQSHNIRQFGDSYPIPEYQHLKFISPWLFSCAEDISFLQIQPTWNFKNPEKMFVPPGILSFKYQGSVEVNAFWPRGIENTVHDLVFGQPLTQYIPLTERKIKLQLHLISHEEFLNRKSISTGTVFLNKYRNNKKILKERGCPFQFKV